MEAAEVVVEEDYAGFADFVAYLIAAYSAASTSDCFAFHLASYSDSVVPCCFDFVGKGPLAAAAAAAAVD